jgi:hypothetical protein
MRIFRCKWEEVTGGWKKLHKKELHNFSLLDTRLIKSCKITGACSIHARKRDMNTKFCKKTRRKETTWMM